MMNTTSDAELLRNYASTNAQDAFAELVRRHVDLVYSTALRQVGGDSHLAQDAAQTVFADLARKADQLARRATLSGWLYTSARFAAAKLARTESRRRDREKRFMRETDHPAPPETDWETIQPALDTAMHELREKDREVILLRYFQNCSLTEVGQKFGLNENAARMRVERALENLRAAFARRGLVTGAALAAVISANAVQPCSAGLATTLAAASFAQAGAGTTSLLKLLTMTQLKFGVGALVLAGTMAALVVQHQKARPEISSAPTQIAAALPLNHSFSNPPAIAAATVEPAAVQPIKEIGTLLVAGFDSDNVVRFDLATGQWSEFARLPGGAQPRGIAVGDDGEIFLGLNGGQKNLVRLIPGNGEAGLTNVTGPIGRYGPGMIAFGQGKIWTAGDTDRLIYQIDPATGDVSTPPQLKNRNNLIGLAMSGNTLYATEYFHRSVLRYEMGPEPKESERFIANDSHLNRPVGLAIGHNGNLYVGNGREPTVIEFDIKTGEFVRTLVDLGAGGKEGIYGIVYSPANQRYYIASGSNVYELDLNGQLLATYNSPALKKAYGIALLPAGLKSHAPSVAANKPALAVHPPSAPPVTNAPSPVTILKTMPGKLQITGKPGERYRVLATTDFKTWTLITTLENKNGTVEFTDQDKAAFDRRFYRIEIQTDPQ